jgi:Na+/proline symporter
LNFLQVTLGYLIGRIVVAVFFLPSYFKGELNTAYAFLETRFGVKTRRFASIIFLFTRTAADGVRLFATAIPLKLLLNIDYSLAIFIIAIVALLYTMIGGVKGIIWVDVIQMFTYIAGAVIAGFIIIGLLPNGLDSLFSAAAADNKFSIINWGFDKGLADFLHNLILY